MGDSPIVNFNVPVLHNGNILMLQYYAAVVIHNHDISCMW